MPIQELDYPFSGGIDEKTQSQLVEPGSALVCRNLRQVKNGSYEKRPGNTEILSPQLDGSSMPICKRLIAYKNELCPTDGLHLYSYSATTDALRQVSGRVSPVSLKTQPTLSLQLGVQSYDCVYQNGYHAIAYVMPIPVAGVDVWGVYGALIDAADGVTVVPAISVSGPLTGGGLAVPPIVLLTTVGTRAVIVYAMSGVVGGDIWTSYIDTVSKTTINAGWSTPVKTINADAYAPPISGPYPLGRNVIFDVCSLDNSAFAIAYVNANATTAAGQNSVTVKTYDSSLSLVATQATINSAVAFGAAPRSIAVGGNSTDVVWVAYPYNDTNDNRVIGLNPTTLAITVTTANVITAGPFKTMAVARTGTQTGMLQGSNDETGGLTMIGDLYTRNFNVATGAANPLGTTLHNYEFNIESRPFQIGTSWYSFVRPDCRSVNLDQLFLVDWTATLADSDSGSGYMRVVANPSPRLAYHPLSFTGPGPLLYHLPRSGAMPHGSAVSATKFVLPSPIKKNAVASSMDLVTFDFADPNRWQPALLGEAVALSGSPPSYYDGVRVSEIGFFTRSQLTAVTTTPPSAPGQGLTGDYKYLVVYEEIDSRGQWHQSAPSDPVTTPTAADEAFIVKCTSLQVSNRSAEFDIPGQVRAALYRTKASGNTYYRVPLAEVANDPSALLLTFAHDEVADSNLSAPCYTQPGEPNTSQVNVNPPALSSMVSHVDRLMGCNGSDVWFSKQHIFGEGYAFCDVFQFPCEEGGDIVALASLDGALVVFKRDKIAFVDGIGPPDNGAGGDFGAPQFIAADVGCIEPRSVVVTPAGVMFQSLRGIEMLSRGRSLTTYFGAHVEDTLQANPVITSAVLDEAKSLVVFTCLSSEDATTDGKQIVWDYVHNIWLTDDLLAGTTNARNQVMVGQLVGTVPVRTSLRCGSNQIVQETSANYLDVGDYVSTELRTPWIKMAGVQGYGRTCGVGILLESKSPCDILVTIRLDYRDTVVQTRLFKADEISLLGAGPKELYVTFKVQKCESFQIELTDASPTGAGVSVGTGQGAAYVGLRIEYQPKQGMPRTSRLRGA